MEKARPGLTVSAPLFFHENEEVDFATLELYLNEVCKNRSISAVYSMAYNTRYRMLSDVELLEVNKFIIDCVKGHGHKVYVGHPYTFTARSLEQYLVELQSNKPDGISMLYPERYYGSPKPILDFLEYPLKFDHNVVLHEMKLVSGFDGELINWPLDLLEAVFQRIPMVAVKEDSKSDELTEQVLKLCKQFGIHCVLAGGGKRRAQAFIEKGMDTWLNGSTMFLPQLIDQTYEAFHSNDEDYIDWYLNNIEVPFFENVVKVFGWHLSHKAALEYFGFGTRWERFPHDCLTDQNYEAACKTFLNIENAIKSV